MRRDTYSGQRPTPSMPVNQNKNLSSLYPFPTKRLLYLNCIQGSPSLLRTFPVRWPAVPLDNVTNGPMVLLRRKLPLLLLHSVCQPLFQISEYETYNLETPDLDHNNQGYTEQWFSAFLMLQSFHYSSSCCVTPPTIKLLLLLLHNCNFATVMKYNVNIYLLINPQRRLQLTS